MIVIRIYRDCSFVGMIKTFHDGGAVSCHGKLSDRDANTKALISREAFDDDEAFHLNETKDYWNIK